MKNNYIEHGKSFLLHNLDSILIKILILSFEKTLFWKTLCLSWFLIDWWVFIEIISIKYQATVYWTLTDGFSFSLFKAVLYLYPAQSPQPGLFYDPWKTWRAPEQLWCLKGSDDLLQHLQTS